MKRLLTLAVVLSALLLSVTPAPAAGPCNTTLTAGSDIQAAITAANPGDVICLSPGVYSPTSRIDITKSVTLQGPQADVDPRPSTGTTRTPGDASTEAIIDGGGSLSTIFRIKADNVVLDGLEVRNGTGDLIDSETSTPTTSTILKYNSIHDSSGDEGVQLRKVAGAVIEYNYVYATGGDGINLCCGSTDGAIQFNEVHNISSPDAGVYVYNSTNTTIQCNLVYDVHNNDGIKLGTKSGGDAALTGGSILYNVVHDTTQDGIAVYTSNTLVEGNEIYNSTSENGAIYAAWAVGGITISNNAVHDNTLQTHKWSDPGAIMIGTLVNAATVQVHHNNISGNSPNGVTNKATASLDAENNWWGATDGPSGDGPGSGDSVSTNVDFDPWLAEPQVIINPCELPQVIEVDIDIKPGSDPNSINLGSKGVVPVALLTTDDFDASTVDPETVVFASAAPVRWVMEDVDGDGDIDMLFHFKTQELELTGDSSEATLTGNTDNEIPFMGTDAVNIVGKDK